MRTTIVQVAMLGCLTWLVSASPAPAQGFTVVDTSQKVCYDGEFSQAVCLGTFDGEDHDSRPAPSTGEGYYYLAKGLDACEPRGYGQAEGVRPDPRDDLEELDPCP